ncbi:hypothetical protein [Novosphingobium kaempferiae]|uniref:hypothetical protein n=1 Tax=Novosphingobium kaempferiae TaxID=2896849 RepID=UPI001E3F90D8|nr:hypothetical protein [Novosphingobium kaempferiae]
MTKIAAVATRNFTWNDRQYAKDQPLQLTGGELTELEHIGFAERAKPKARTKRRASTTAKVTAPVAPTTEPEADPAD